MNVFISWSGKKSLLAAKAFYDALRLISPKAEFYISTSIDKGARWNPRLAQALSHADFGILCVAGDNCTAPWLVYEAGVLSRTAGEDHVAPFLLDIRSSEICGPLSQFQATTFEKEDLRNLIFTINRVYGEDRLSEDILARLFEMVYETMLAEALRKACGAAEENEEDAAKMMLAALKQLLDLSKENQTILKDIRSNLTEKSCDDERAKTDGKNQTGRQNPLF